MKSIRFPVAILACTAAAFGSGCSSDDDGVMSPGDDPSGMDPPGTEPPGMDPPDDDPASMLPNGVLSGTNGTMPCDPALDTGFEGDELCILPADPGTGAFFHAGPTDYDDPEQIAAFTMEAGGENTQYYIAESNNDDMIWFRNQHYRMRPGSHHLIMYTLTPNDQPPPEIGWIEEETIDRAGPLGGTQVYAMDFPEGGKVAPEDTNLVRPLSARMRLAFEMHYVNPGDEPILREAWVNLMHNDIPVEDRVILGAPFLVGARFNVPPQTTHVVNYKHEIPAGPSGGPQDLRIVSFFGHRHASTTRFSIWLNRSGERELVYEDYDWSEAREFFYNTVIENPMPDPASSKAGATSGQLFMTTGDVLEWECEIRNTLDMNLTFGNGVYVKEMCNVFGTLTSTGSIVLYGFPQPTITEM